MKKIKQLSILLCAIVLCLGAVGNNSEMTVNALTTNWSGNSASGWYANHNAALNEIKTLMQQQTSSYNMQRFNVILSEFPLSGYFNLLSK